MQQWIALLGGDNYTLNTKRARISIVKLQTLKYHVLLRAFYTTFKYIPLQYTAIVLFIDVVHQSIIEHIKCSIVFFNLWLIWKRHLLSKYTVTSTNNFQAHIQAYILIVNTCHANVQHYIDV